MHELIIGVNLRGSIIIMKTHKHANSENLINNQSMPTGTCMSYSFKI